MHEEARRAGLGRRSHAGLYSTIRRVRVTRHHRSRGLCRLVFTHTDNSTNHFPICPNSMMFSNHRLLTGFSGQTVGWTATRVLRPSMGVRVAQRSWY